MEDSTNRVERLRLVQENSKWGYADKEGRVVIPCRYDIAYDFRTDYAIVANNGYFGLIDRSGSVVIPLEYTNMMYNHYSKIAIVAKFPKVGAVNLKNEVIIPMEYDRVLQFGTDVFYVRANRKVGLLDSKGREILPVNYDAIRRVGLSGSYVVREGDKYALFCGQGESLEFKYDFVSEVNCQNLIRVKRDGGWGFVNEEGHEVIPPIYQRAWDFHGLAALVKLNGEWLYQPSQPTLVNRLLHKNGAVPVMKAMRSDDTAQRYDSYIVRFKDGALFVEDELSDALIPIDIDWVGIFYKNSQYASVMKDGKFGIIDSRGEITTPCTFDFLRVEGDYASVEIDGKYGLIDMFGNYVIAPTTNRVYAGTDGYVMIVSPDNKKGCVGVGDKAGVSIPCKYDSIGSFSESGNAAVCIDGKWGILNTKNEFVVPMIYDRIFPTGHNDSFGLEKYDEHKTIIFPEPK